MKPLMYLFLFENQLIIHDLIKKNVLFVSLSIILYIIKIFELSIKINTMEKRYK